MTQNNLLGMEVSEGTIISALTAYKKGNTRGYDILVTQLSDPNVSKEFLISSLKQLKACVSQLTKEYEVLIGALLRLDWLSHDGVVAKEYQSFILNLVSSTTYYLRACLRMILRQFSSNDETGAVPTEVLDQDAARFQKLHTMLQALLYIVPIAPKVLLPLLSDCFPFMHRSAYQQECYARNLLHMTHYLPAHRASLLEVIVERMMKLDVRAPRSEIQEAECEGDTEADIFLMEGEDPRRGSMPHKDADRLDVLLTTVFSFINSVCFRDGTLYWEATKKLYREMLLVFDRIILPTHACCHVQFILFYMCSLKQPLVEGFLDFLLKKIQNPNTGSVFRQMSAAYVASLLARAKYIHVSTVRECLDLLVTWIHAYISNASHLSAHTDPSHHGPFQSVCQAVFYILVFRHKQLLGMKQGVKYCQGLQLQTIVTSHLNPLRVCLPIIANTFSSITRMHQLAYCDTVLERNRRNMLPSASNSSLPQDTRHNPLDSFFPFDPYLLHRSKKFIVDLYQEYEGSPVNEDDDDMEQDSEENVYAEESSQSSADVSHITEQMLGATPSSLKSADLLMYGTSPGFTHMVS